jgi:2-iminobutanoate/2-iminopropanoate deaminase
MPKEIIRTDKAPGAVGPYSQAIKVGNLLFLSGQVGLDPATGKLAGDDVGTQLEQVIHNITAVLEAAGSSLQQVVKATVFLYDMDDYPQMNEIYARHFGANPPARSAVAVDRLPLGALVEIEVIALSE